MVNEGELVSKRNSNMSVHNLMFELAEVTSCKVGGDAIVETVSREAVGRLVVLLLEDNDSLLDVKS